MDSDEIMLKICKRAEEMGITRTKRITLFMDLDHANEEFDLRLGELLEASNLDFTHDICGIQRHIDRSTGKMGDLFVPRYAR